MEKRIVILFTCYEGNQGIKTVVNFVIETEN